MSTPSGPLTTFKIFPNLPYELRCMIWEATCLPRLIEIEYDEDEGFTPRNCDPIALKICKESRKLIEQSYPLCFGSIFHPPKTRFNFAIDTLYIGNEIEEHVPHFFSTFGPLEISSLQVLALEDCYNETTLPFETTLTSQLQRMVKKFTGLRELLIVYDVVAMTDRTIDCADGHPLEIHTEIPSELKHPSVMIDPLPKDEDAEAHGFKLWEVKKCNPVYGWRRCPGGVSFSDLDLSLEDDMSDEENFGLYGPWGGPPPPLAMGLARMFGGPLDSDEEDDMFGYGVDFDEDDEESDDLDEDDDEEDDEEDQDDAASIDSVD
ncbi:hypothetical protein IFR04_002139 [Cadophora malorum]|uniref:2EXR domain-containing protein n=1 Tax=Cadophora malorum TaxID=108018 RepID=A0A8H8BUS7_9HELO|nr:hypothetical protein IFR04_002139 [Cadophora malorum]